MFGSGSPQSTLCAFGSGCGLRKGSSDGSPSSTHQLSSQKATWDLLHAAAGEVEKMRLSEEAYGFNSHRGLLSLSPVTLSVKDPNSSDVGLYTHQSLSHQQIRMLQVSFNHSSSLLWMILVLDFAIAFTLESILTYSSVFLPVLVSDSEAATNGEAT